MKALFYNFYQRRFILKEIPLPKIKTDEVLLKIKASALCGSDLHIMEGPLRLKAYNRREIILGHSFAGVIFKTGKMVKKFKKGDKVFASNFIWCGRCQRCRNGQENLCDRRFIFGLEVPGSHAEYLALPQRVLFPIPSGVDFLEAAQITDLLTLCWHSFKKVDLRPKEKVVIFGLGPVGLTMGMLLKSFKINSIFALDPRRNRCFLAKKFFQAEIIDRKKLKKLEGQFDVVFEASGNIKAPEKGFKLLKRGGKMVVVGVHRQKFNLNILKLVSREISIFGVFHYPRKEIEESLELLKNKQIDFKKLITYKFNLQEGQLAYRLLKKKEGGRIILLP